jgi:hypothetical protein
MTALAQPIAGSLVLKCAGKSCLRVPPQQLVLNSHFETNLVGSLFPEACHFWPFFQSPLVEQYLRVNQGSILNRRSRFHCIRVNRNVFRVCFQRLITC